MGQREILGVLIGFWIMVISPPAHSTTFLYMPTWELYDNSAMITIGTVAKTTSFWDSDRRMIFTRADIAIEETLKGADHGKIQVITPGGTVENIHMRVHGASQFYRNERILLYLTPLSTAPKIPEAVKGNGTYTVTGYTMGKFNILLDDLTGVELIDNRLDDISLVDRKFTPIASKHQKSKYRTLEEIKREVQELNTLQ